MYKSFNVFFVRRLDSLYKYRLLLKLIMVVIILGFIVFIFGFYLLDLKNNDVSIFKYMI